MKNVKKLLQKAMVFTLAASMLVGTPLTASAAGIRGVYSVSDGNENITENENDSGTGTVTSTNTETGSGVLNENDAKIIGIVLDKDIVKAEAGEPEYLTATIITDGDVSAADLEKLQSKIRWELSNADDVEGEPAKRNPAAYVSISTPNGAGDRTYLKLNPKKGTKDGEEVVVTAKIDNTYYFDENHELKEYVTKREPYTASATVSVKEYSKDLKFDEKKIHLALTDGKTDEYSGLLKHAVDFSDYLIREPASANDDIIWVSTNTKGATVTAAGVVTFKKAGEAGDIYAVGEKGAKAVYHYEVAQGEAATKVEITELDVDETPLKSKTIDIQTDDGEEYNVGVKMYAKKKNVVISAADSKKAYDGTGDYAKAGNGTPKTGTIEVANGDKYYTVEAGELKEDTLIITDTIAWTSNKKAVADVVGDSDGATITALNVGKAVITAKASSGKSAKLNVTVTATLQDLEFDAPQELYSGQSVTLVPIRSPKANNDAVVWSVTALDGSKTPNATINAKGVLTIKPLLKTKVNDDGEDVYGAIWVTLKPKKNATEATTAAHKIELTQSSVEEIYVKEGKEIFASAVVTRKDNGTVKSIAKNKDLSTGASNTRTINVPKGKTYDIVAMSTKDMNLEESAEKTLSFKTSNAKFVSIDPSEDGKTLKVKAEAKGKATVTVSGVCMSGNSAKTISTTFVINVVQPVKTLTMNKPEVAINEKYSKGVLANQAIALKVTLGPKGVDTKEEITWQYKKTKENGKDIANAEFKDATDAKGNALTKASASVNLPKPEIGDQFVIQASTKSGATATATVNVVTKTTAVAIASEAELKDDVPQTFTKNARDAKIGEKFTIHPFINVGTAKAPDWQKAGAYVEADGDAVAKNVEDVTYSVNKKGIVTVDKDGTVHVLNKGNVTITAKTPQGKKATLKVNVKTTELYVEPSDKQ